MTRAAASVFLDQKTLPRHGTVKAFEADFRTALAEARHRLAAQEAQGLQGEFVRVKQLAASVVSMCAHLDVLSGLGRARCTTSRASRANWTPASAPFAAPARPPPADPDGDRFARHHRPHGDRFASTWRTGAPPTQSGWVARNMNTPKENTMKETLTWRMAKGGGGGEGGDGLPGEPWPGPEEPPSPDGGPRGIG
ncbi:hypothetical protein [Streptomyces sp. NPDC026659]|uniref:hypothetical protein n=1 Tax=Streptomyces sp. NPDC026659 TaxID=3155123 RepID=UPI0033CD0A8E